MALKYIILLINKPKKKGSASMCKIFPKVWFAEVIGNISFIYNVYKDIIRKWKYKDVGAMEVWSEMLIYILTFSLILCIYTFVYILNDMIWQVLSYKGRKSKAASPHCALLTTLSSNEYRLLCLLYIYCIFNIRFLAWYVEVKMKLTWGGASRKLNNQHVIKPQEMAVGRLNVHK